MAIDSPFQGTTLVNVGSAVAPGGGTTLAAITTTQAGWYRVVVKVGYGSTADTVTNIRMLINNGTVFSVLPAVGPNVLTEYVFERLLLSAVVNAVQIANVGAGAASSVYIASVVATQLEN